MTNDTITEHRLPSAQWASGCHNDRLQPDPGNGPICTHLGLSRHDKYPKTKLLPNFEYPRIARHLHLMSGVFYL